MAAYFLMQKKDHTLNDLILMKLIVIVEREALAKTTSLICGARFFSMQHGPVLSEVYDQMKGNEPSTLWSQCIRFEPYSGPGTSDNRCVLVDPIEVSDYLSTHEIGLLSDVWNRYGVKDKWSLVQLTHTFPEWNCNCQQTKSSSPIALDTILKLGFNRQPDVADAQAAEVEYFESLAS